MPWGCFVNGCLLSSWWPFDWSSGGWYNSVRQVAVRSVVSLVLTSGWLTVGAGLWLAGCDMLVGLLITCVQIISYWSMVDGWLFRRTQKCSQGK